MAQLVKNPPAMRETWVRSLGWENPLEKGKAIHSSILGWRMYELYNRMLSSLYFKVIVKFIILRDREEMQVFPKSFGDDSASHSVVSYSL